MIAARDTDARMSRSYSELIDAFPLRPIRSEERYGAAIVQMRTLTGREELTDDEDDYLDVLGDLIKKYEDEHHPVPAPTPAQRLRVFLDRNKTSQAELSRATGIPESTISAILKGTRGISKASAIALAKFFGVSADRFLAA